MNEGGLVTAKRIIRMNYGRAIRIVRTARRLTQSALAERLSIGSSHLSLIEADKRKPSLRVLDEIAEALNVPTHLLMLLAAGPKELENDTDSKQVAALARSLLNLLVSTSDQPPLPMRKRRTKKALKDAS